MGWSAKVRSNPALGADAIKRLNFRAEALPVLPPPPPPPPWTPTAANSFRTISPPPVRPVQTRYRHTVNTYVGRPAIPPTQVYKPVADHQARRRSQHLLRVGHQRAQNLTRPSPWRLRDLFGRKPPPPRPSPAPAQPIRVGAGTLLSAGAHGHRSPGRAKWCACGSPFTDAAPSHVGDVSRVARHRQRRPGRTRSAASKPTLRSYASKQVFHP